MAANPSAVHANATLRGLRVDPTGALVSARAAPANAPTVERMRSTAILAVNGHRIVTPQRAKLSYLADTKKHQIPVGLFQTKTTTTVELGRKPEALRTYNTFRHAAGATGIADADRYTIVRAGGGDELYTNAPGTYQAAADAATARVKLEVTLQVGDYTDAGVFTARSAANEECGAYLTFTYGTDPDDCFIVVTNITSDTVTPPGPAAIVDRQDVRDQLSDEASIACGLNYSVVDFGFLNDPANRWTDNQCNVRQPATRYTPRLSPYTIGMVAGLNVAALENAPRLAWTRAYCLSMGFLPVATSRHNVEYQTTAERPSDEELKLVMEDHDVGEDGQIYVRGCLSIAAAFGALHLANDHTFKSNDDNLKRKAATMIRATRTTLTEGEADILSNATYLEASARTCMHCFGLSSPLGAFYDGQVLHLLAEPLQIRDSVVPPPVAKYGLVNSIMNKIFALPIGGMFRTAYGRSATEISTVCSNIIQNATAYSSLHVHYGVDNQLTPSAANELLVNSFLPVVSGYALVFEVDADGRPMGALYSQTIANCMRDSAGLVEMYRTAFEMYKEGGTNLKALITAATGSDPAASSTAVARA